MLTYSGNDLRALRRDDVTLPRDLRKVIFSHNLWLPKLQRRHTQCKHRLGISTRQPIESTRRQQQNGESADCQRLPLPQSTGDRSCVTFGCINIRSVLHKFDDINELFRDRHLELLCITESWHHTNSAVLGRLRCSGFNVVDRPRPHVSGADNFSVNQAVFL